MNSKRNISSFIVTICSVFVTAIFCATACLPVNAVAANVRGASQVDPSTENYNAQRLSAADGAASDAFGQSVAISGKTAVVGTPLSDVNGHADQGVVYVYEYNSNSDAWTPEAKLIAPNGNAASQFGYTVAIDGGTIVVGARRTDPNDKGAAYVFVRSGASWTPQAKLVSNDGLPGDRFGEAVAISGNTIVVGAPLYDIPGTPDVNKGAAYVFTRTNSVWTEQARLTEIAPQDYDFFGNAVAIDGDTALIGAPESNGNFRIGSAYVFTRLGNSWSQKAQLQSKDSAQNDNFGGSVAISGQTAVVAASDVAVGGTPFQGAVHVFTGAGANWSEQARLTADDGANGFRFGSAVSLNGEQLVIGASGNRVNGGANQGSAYLFKRSGSLWSETGEFIAQTGASSDLLGQSVAVDGDFIIAGAPQKSVNLNNIVDSQQHGATYIFSSKTTSTAPVIQSVSIKGKKLIVTGARFDSPTQTYVDGEKQKKTFNDEVTPDVLVVANKAGKFIAPGQTVKVQVRNANTGETSNEFMFTRPE